MVKQIGREETSDDIATPAEMTVKQAGRRGGNITRDRYGRDFYQKIGAEGGRRTAELYADLLKEFGKRGGRPRRPTLDSA
jgi:general stress protein YciG